MLLPSATQSRAFFLLFDIKLQDNEGEEGRHGQVGMRAFKTSPFPNKLHHLEEFRT